MSEQPNVTEPQQRANREGDPCPPWCTVDHHTPMFPDDRIDHYEERHHNDGTRIPLSSKYRGSCDYARVRAYQRAGSEEATAELMINRSSHRMFHWPDSRAGITELATLIDLLADATPAQHRKIATELRNAIELGTGGDGDE